MIIYFDTNIYSYLALSSETDSLVNYLRKNKYTVAVSLTTILESARAEEIQCKKQFDAIATVANKFLHPDSSYLECKEIRQEIKRCHPEWINPKPEVSRVNFLLEKKKQIWRQLKRGKSVNLNLNYYKALMEDGIKRNNYLQKTRRRAELDGLLVEPIISVPGLQDVINKIPSQEGFWRLIALQSYVAALEGEPSSMDIAGWLLPFLNLPLPSKFEWGYFWLAELSSEFAIRNKITYLASYIQTKYPITHGNDIDAEHVPYLLDCDMFFTRDKNFFKLLNVLMAEVPVGIKIAQPFLLKPDSQGIISAIDNAINNK